MMLPAVAAALRCSDRDKNLSRQQQRRLHFYLRRGSIPRPVIHSHSARYHSARPYACHAAMLGLWVSIAGVIGDESTHL